MKFTPIVLLLFFTYTLQAQVSLGGKAGVHLGNWKTNDMLLEDGEELNSNIAFQAGFVANFGIAEKLSLQTELYYIQKGTKVKGEDFFSSMEVNSKVVLNYLELPVLLKVQFNNSEDGPSFFGLAGPSIGYALSGKLVSEAIINGTKIKETQDLEFDDNDGFRRTEFSLAIGAGVNIPTGPGNVVIDLRYLLGLSNLNDEGDGASVKNRGIGLAVGYLIPLGE